MAVVGALLVKLGPALVAPVVRVIQSWLQRPSAKSVELELNGQKITPDRSRPEHHLARLQVGVAPLSRRDRVLPE